MGMKVFTDTESQFFARVFQPTASSLKMEPRQTTAANLQTTANQASASLLNATVKQTNAANLQATVRQGSASLLNATVKQTAAANLQTTANQSSASLLQATVRQGSASLLNATVKQTTAANLQATVRQGSASLLNATVKQTNAANLFATVRNSTTASLLKVYANIVQSTASALQMTLGNRGTRDVTSAIGVTSSVTYANAPAQNVLTLSKFAFLVKGGTAASNVKLQLSPVGGTVASNWIDDDTVTRTLAANTLTILEPTRFSKFVRLAAKQSGAASATLTVYYQGQV